MHRSLARCLIVSFLTLFVFATVVAPVSASFHGDRVVFERDFAFTGSEVANVTEDMAGDIAPGAFVYQLSDSGSGTHAFECGFPGGGSFDIYWISEPVFVDPPEELRDSSAYIRPLNDLNITMPISAGSGETNALGPVAGGPVNFRMNIGWMNPGETAVHWHGGWQATDSLQPGLGDDLSELGLPGLPGPLSGPVELEMATGDESTGIRTGTVLVFRLEITCEEFADFTLDFGAPVNMDYIWGDANDRDTTGGGVPDKWAMYPDGTQWSYDDQVRYGTDPFNAQDTPDMEAADCPGHTVQQVIDEGCPAGGLSPILLLILMLLIVVLLVGGAYGAVTTVNKKVRMAVSHDGFQDITQGASAQYELTLTAKGKPDEEVPVEISLKGVPEDWSASIDPAHVTLIAGEEPEPVTATLTVTPPPEEQYEAEAVVTVTATPTDADGKTSPLKPGTSVKTKTIVNIDVEPPEGHKPKKSKKKPTEEEALQAEDGEKSEGGGLGKLKGALGGLARKGKKKDEGETGAAEADDAEAGAEEGLKADAGQATAMKKPDLAVGKLAHEPADFSAGDTVTTRVPVKNKGDEAVKGLLLRLYVNDDRVDEQELDLEPGDASEVTFTWTAQPDENRVRVRGGLKEA
jgi:hypothetical protein